MQKNKTLKQLKVLMLRYKLKERAKTEDKLRMYNFDEEVSNKKEFFLLLKQLGDPMKTTTQGEELKLHDDNKGNVRSVIEKYFRRLLDYEVN